MTTLEITTVNPAEFGLDADKTIQIREAFMPKIIERENLVSIYKEIVSQEISEEVSLQAGALRKKLVKVRTGISEVHQSQKAFFLSACRFVDAWKNKETKPVLQMEEALFDIEKHFELIEQKRLEELGKVRTQELLKFNPQFIPDNLGKMEAHVWDSYVLGVKLSFEAEQKRIADAEAERIAKEKADAEALAERQRKEAEERARIELENAKLKAEAEERERQSQIEEKARAEAEAKKRAEEAKKQAEFEAKLKAERDALAKVQAELKAKEQAEEKARAEAEAKKQAEEKAKSEELRKSQNAPDKQKLKDFAKSIKAMERPQVNSIEAKAILSNIEDLMIKLTDYINTKSEAL